MPASDGLRGPRRAALAVFRGAAPARRNAVYLYSSGENYWFSPIASNAAVRQLRDWFTQFPYLSKLREPQVLARAISEAIARSDAKYAIADRFDEAKNEYLGLKLGRLVDVDLNSDMLLVRADVAQAQIAKTEQAPTGGGSMPGDKQRQRLLLASRPLPTEPRRPRRFYAKVTLTRTARRRR